MSTSSCRCVCLSPRGLSRPLPASYFFLVLSRRMPLQYLKRHVNEKLPMQYLKRTCERKTDDIDDRVCQSPPRNGYVSRTVNVI